MLPDVMLTGLMPERTISLTFDDGPGATAGPGAGPRTLAIAEYLASQDISATFFMCGQHVLQHPHVPPAVAALGHRLGSHAFSHRQLSTLAEAEEIRHELRATLDVLMASGASLPVPFRPPYGDWDARTAAAVNADPDLAAAHSGAYGWDLGGWDYQSWEQAVPDGRQLAEEFLEQARHVGAGVMLIHDNTADNTDFPGRGAQLRAGNRALDTLTRLVPRLQDDGFAFAPLPG
jgi:peptidoglycan/xylan/chitin deacetylase (PgdA/CDA1 family)